MRQPINERKITAYFSPQEVFDLVQFRANGRIYKRSRSVAGWEWLVL